MSCENCNTDQIIVPIGPSGNTPYIGANDNWWIGNTDTGVLATGVSDAYNSLDTRLDTAETDITNLEAADVAIDARLDLLEAINIPTTVKRYKVNLTQTSNNEPTEDASFIDDFGGVWSYSSAGTYYYTKTGAFPDNDKIFITLHNNISTANAKVSIERDTNNRLVMLSALSIDTSPSTVVNTLTDGLITKMSLLIEVYP